jgi:hypothetical protein
LQLEISQYTFSEAGASACTAIALFAVKHLVQTLDRGQPVDIASDGFRIALSEAIFAGVSHFGTLTVARDRHASVEEISGAVTNELTNVTDAMPIQGMLSDRACFANMFESVRSKVTNRGKFTGIVLTKPPETVCVVVPPLDCPAGTGTYMFFDSHSRPELGFDGCYLVSSTSEADIIHRLNTIFPAFAGFGGSEGFGDEDGGEGGAEQWCLAEAMYNMVDATGFQSNTSSSSSDGSSGGGGSSDSSSA